VALRELALRAPWRLAGPRLTLAEASGRPDADSAPEHAAVRPLRMHLAPTCC